MKHAYSKIPCNYSPFLPEPFPLELEMLLH